MVAIPSLYVYIYSKDNVLLPQPNQRCITTGVFLDEKGVHDLGLGTLKGGLTSQQIMKYPSSQKWVYVKRNKVVNITWSLEVK